MSIQWRPVTPDDVLDSYGCIVADGVITFHVESEGEVDDPASGTYYAQVGANPVHLRATPVAASVSPFAGNPPAPVFAPAWLAGFETVDRVDNGAYTGSDPLAEPLEGWTSAALETTAKFLDFHGATTGGVYNVQTAAFAVELQVGGDTPDPPEACFWTDLVATSQDCGDAPIPDRPALYLTDVGLGHAYIVPGAVCIGGEMSYCPYSPDVPQLDVPGMGSALYVTGVWRVTGITAYPDYQSSDCARMDLGAFEYAAAAAQAPVNLYHNGAGVYFFRAGHGAGSGLPNFGAADLQAAVGNGWTFANGDLVVMVISDGATRTWNLLATVAT